MTLTLEQQIAATNWQRLNREQIKARLMEWQRYMDNKMLFDLIAKHHHRLPLKLTKIMDSMNMMYGSVYDTECEAQDEDETLFCQNKKTL